MLFENQQDAKQVTFEDDKSSILSPAKQDKKVQNAWLQGTNQTAGQGGNFCVEAVSHHGHLTLSPTPRGNRYFWWQASRIAEQLVCSVGTNALLHVEAS